MSDLGRVSREVNPFPPGTGVLLIAHGSRSQTANQDLVEVARQLAARTGLAIVETSYLELTEPTITEGCRRCIERGARLVMMLPYFLSAGVHVTADLERYRTELSQAYPQATIRLCPPIGLHEGMIAILQDRLTEGVAGSH